MHTEGVRTSVAQKPRDKIEGVHARRQGCMRDGIASFSGFLNHLVHTQYHFMSYKHVDFARLCEGTAQWD